MAVAEREAAVAPAMEAAAPAMEAAAAVETVKEAAAAAAATRSSAALHSFFQVARPNSDPKSNDAARFHSYR